MVVSTSGSSLSKCDDANPMECAFLKKFLQSVEDIQMKKKQALFR
jgi:hypothetical protein